MFVAILTATIAIAHFSGSGLPAPEPPPEPPTTEVQTEWQTEEPTVPLVQVDYIPKPTFSVNGAYLDYDLQMFLRKELAAYGCEWFFPTALCQIYGESRYDPYAQNPNGLDKGLCQLRETYWPAWTAQAGWTGASIYDPYAQIKVYAMLMSGYLYASGYNTGRALSMYYLGADGYAEDYVNYIMGFLGMIREEGR